jgi:poly-beta-1,6-N-acetyl-D-glucosamine synthase
MLTHALVTPARNEAENLRRLADCIASQTRQPEAWVIVDHGSTDETGAVAAELARVLPWTRVLTLPGEAIPTRGGPVAQAFVAGVELLEQTPDVVVKVDADITFAPEYFERLLAEFEADPKLGIASGTCYELEDGTWRPKHVTGGRVRGASRAYRWACLQEVLPLENRPGWDGIDDLKAVARGWRTASFAALRFDHHRKLGRRDESRRRRLFEVGKACWFIGYRPSYLILRALYKALREPAALAMIAGYLAGWLRREERCSDRLARQHLRSEQSFRALPLRVREALGRRVA